MNSHLQQQKLIQQGQCQYVQLLDYNSAAGRGGQSSTATSNMQAGGSSASNLYSFAPFMSVQPPQLRQEYVQQTLSEIAQRPKKERKTKSIKAPFKRQQIPINTAASTKLPGRAGGAGSKVNRAMLREENYNVFIPKKSLTCQQFNAKVECRGCSKEYAGTIISAGSIFGEPNFFIHCVKECAAYRALGKSSIKLDEVLISVSQIIQAWQGSVMSVHYCS